MADRRAKDICKPKYQLSQSCMNNVINEGKFEHLTQFGSSGNTETNHCVKSVRIRSFSSPYSV